MTPELLGEVGEDIPASVADWLSAGSSVVSVTLPHQQGPTANSLEEVGPAPVAEAWKGSHRHKREAETERFEHQIRSALADDARPTATMSQTDTLRHAREPTVDKGKGLLGLLKRKIWGP